MVTEIQKEIFKASSGCAFIEEMEYHFILGFENLQSNEGPHRVTYNEKKSFWFLWLPITENNNWIFRWMEWKFFPCEYKIKKTETYCVAHSLQIIFLIEIKKVEAISSEKLFWYWKKKRKRNQAKSVWNQYEKTFRRQNLDWKPVLRATWKI